MIVYTRDHPERFAQAFNKLAATKGMPVDEIKITSYYETCADLPIEAIETACSTLQREASKFLPDAGTLYRTADTIACESLEKQTTSEARQLTSGVDIEEGIIADTIRARDKFLADMEQLTGIRLPDDHPMRTTRPRIPTFACNLCEDQGFVPAQRQGPYVRYKRCLCFDENPVFEQQRARAKLRKSRAKAPAE